MSKYLYFFSLFLLCLGQLTNISKSDGVNIYAFDAVVALFAVFGLVYFVLIKKLLFPRYLLLAIPFCFIAGISLFLNYPHVSLSQFAVSSSYLLRLFLYTLSGIIFYNMLMQNKISDAEYKWSLYLAGIFVGIGGLIQLAVLPDFTVLNPELGWDPHQNRLASTFFDPNFVGAFLNIILAVLLSDLSSKKLDTRKYAVFFFLVFCVFLTFSRSAWGMLAIIIFLYGLFKNKKLLYASFVLIFLAYFAVPRVQTRLSGITDPADSAYYRLESWGNALTLVKDNYLLGVGYNTYKYAQLDAGLLNGDTVFEHSASGSDSSFLFILVTTGVVGLVSFILWWFLPVLSTIKEKATSQNLALISIILGLSLESQFINSIFYPQILFLIMMVFARSSVSRNSQ